MDRGEDGWLRRRTDRFVRSEIRGNCVAIAKLNSSRGQSPHYFLSIITTETIHIQLNISFSIISNNNGDDESEEENNLSAVGC